MFTSIDYDKFRELRVTHIAARFEDLINDEANDELTPEQLFLTAADDALEQRRINKWAVSSSVDGRTLGCWFLGCCWLLLGLWEVAV